MTQVASQKLVMQAKGLVKRYGQVTALDGADFELRAGSTQHPFGLRELTEFRCPTLSP